MDEKFGRNDDGRKKSGGGVEKPQARLFADVCQMSEIPRNQIIDFVNRGEREMQRVGDKSAMEYAARNITFGENGGFFGEIERFNRRDEPQISGAVRLADLLNLAPHENRAERSVFVEFVFPPANRQIAPKRFAVV